MAESTLRARALRAREILTGESRERGLLKWFQDEVEAFLGLKKGEGPSPTTIHRWFLVPPLRTMGPEYLAVLKDTERRARKVESLRKKIEEVR